ncbi:DUF4181 domain-containing protein [Halobacillus yeomjeoni]|uniref:DUF4181 domain-containing protein n=1 Tax=Halobacillus yeomjeoni TaxID=311194 RepID=A0A931HTX8_9BACI|nr:DUF4181 domain-containing protein [Halobacillus yeomjeoni]MBH0229685.1 DUF4181 domain-containing protein [Halobacillus yeomjeoni]
MEWYLMAGVFVVYYLSIWWVENKWKKNDRRTKNILPVSSVQRWGEAVIVSFLLMGVMYFSFFDPNKELSRASFLAGLTTLITFRALMEWKAGRGFKRIIFTAFSGYLLVVIFTWVSAF